MLLDSRSKGKFTKTNGMDDYEALLTNLKALFASRLARDRRLLV